MCSQQVVALVDEPTLIREGVRLDPVKAFTYWRVEGHIIKASYSPYDSLTIGVTYFLAELIANIPLGFDEDIGRLQLDAVWKF